MPIPDHRPGGSSWDSSTRIAWAFRNSWTTQILLLTSIGTKGKASEGAGVFCEDFAFGQAAIFPSKSWKLLTIIHFLIQICWHQILKIRAVLQLFEQLLLFWVVRQGSSHKLIYTRFHQIEASCKGGGTRLEALPIFHGSYLSHAWNQSRKWYQNVWKSIPGFSGTIPGVSGTIPVFSATKFSMMEHECACFLD